MTVDLQDEKLALYDAVLTQIDEEAGVTVFAVAGTQHCLRSGSFAWWTPGTVGRLRLPSPEAPFGFYAYPDQRLRRVPAEDDPDHKRWAWQIAGRFLTCKAGIIPGKDGVVVPEDTQRVFLNVPREFIDLCRASQLLPETVLRGFIADLCQLMNWAYCPREDEYSSNGSDERRMAWLYFERAYGWLTASDEAG